MSTPICKEASGSTPWTLLTLLIAAIGCSLATNRSAEAQIPQLIHYEGRIAVSNTNFDGTGQFKFAFVDGGANPSVTATATATVVSGFVVAIQLVNGGSGYVSPPAVTLTDSFGTGATATATVSGGAVTSISVTNAGFGYSPFPTVSVASPVVYTTYWSNDGSSVAGSEPGSFVSLPVSKGLYSLNLGDTALPNMTALPVSIFTHSDVRLRIWFNDGVRGFQQLSPDQRVAAVGYALMADNIKDGAITSAKIAAGAIGTAQIATGGIQGANIASGTIGSAQIAFGGIQMSNISNGAVGSAQLASGAVGFANFAKPPQSGTVEGSGLSPFAGNGPFSVTFPQPYSSPPIVTVTAESPTSPGVTVQLTGVTAAGFSGIVSNFEPSAVTLDARGTVGLYTSINQVNGRLAIGYYDSTLQDLKYVRSISADGSIWAPPITVQSSLSTGSFVSLEVVNGSPAMSYQSPSLPSNLNYVRAVDADGTAWGTPISLNNPGTVSWTSLDIINGRPAITFLLSGSLRYVRAADADGSAWGGPLFLDSATTTSPSMLTVNTFPAIAYTGTNGPRYIRAIDPDGASWGSAVDLDFGVGTGAANVSMAIVNGRPAVSYQDVAQLDLKYVRSLDQNGSAWGSPIAVDGIGSVGSYNALTSMGGKPAILYSDATNLNVKLVRALDTDGATWGVPVTLNGSGSVGTYVSAIETTVGDHGVAFYDATNGELKFLRLVPVAAPLRVNWIALPP